MNMTPVGATSRWVAACRAAETESPDALFHDPYARPLAGKIGFDILRAEADFTSASFPHARTDVRSPLLSIRTRFIDDALQRAVTQHNLQQVVLLAAGMDARPFRFDWPTGLRWFELDRPEIFDIKEPILAELHARPRCHRTIVPTDLAHDWITPLTAAGFDPARPAAFLIEGLFYYLEPSTVDALLQALSGISAPGSWCVADMVNDAMLTSPYTQPMIARRAAMGCPWLFGAADPAALFARFGWRAQPHSPDDPAVGRGRWPYPRAPEGIPGLPRCYLVTAER